MVKDIWDGTKLHQEIIPGLEAGSVKQHPCIFQEDPHEGNQPQVLFRVWQAKS